MVEVWLRGTTKPRRIGLVAIGGRILFMDVRPGSRRWVWFRRRIQRGTATYTYSDSMDRPDDPQTLQPDGHPVAPLPLPPDKRAAAAAAPPTSVADDGGPCAD